VQTHKVFRGVASALSLGEDRHIAQSRNATIICGVIWQVSAMNQSGH